MKPPSAGLLLTEAPRAFFEASTLVPARPILSRAPRGDGHAVLVLPGFTATDASTRILRRYLERLGHAVHPWRLGRNLGPTGDLPARLLRRFHDVQAKHGGKVSLVGWSLGGIFAREIARAVPGLIRQVITLGSPFRGGGHASNARRLYELLTRDRVARMDPAMVARLEEPPPVPSTAIYSKTDGIAAWQSCMEITVPHTDNIEVVGSHCGLGVNPAVLYAVADRLALPDGEWARFDRAGLRRLFYS